MGVSVRALSGMGVLLTASELPLKEMVRGCSHHIPEDVKFCPECGKPRLEEKEKPIWKLQEEAELGEDDIYEFYPSRIFFMGKILAQNGFNIELSKYRTNIPTEVEAVEAKELVKNALEKLGLPFDESKFGLWTIPEAS